MIWGNNSSPPSFSIDQLFLESFPKMLGPRRRGGEKYFETGEAKKSEENNAETFTF